MSLRYKQTHMLCWSPLELLWWLSLFYLWLYHLRPRVVQNSSIFRKLHISIHYCYANCRSLFIEINSCWCKCFSHVLLNYCRRRKDHQSNLKNVEDIVEIQHLCLFHVLILQICFACCYFFCTFGGCLSLMTTVTYIETEFSEKFLAIRMWYVFIWICLQLILENQYLWYEISIKAVMTVQKRKYMFDWQVTCEQY